MSFPTAIHTVKTSASKALAPKVNPAILKRPHPLPQRPLAPNRFTKPKGQRQIFLPNFVVTLVRSPQLAPIFASFLTPLWFSKLDLKDYLFNLYGLQVLNVRSYVIQSKVREDKPGVRQPRPRKWYRPQSKKKMTVEMVDDGAPGQGPFVWPQEPEDMSPWGRRNAEDEIEDMKKAYQDRARRSQKWPADMGIMAKRAREMIEQVKSRGSQKEEDEGRTVQSRQTNVDST